VGKRSAFGVMESRWTNSRSPTRTVSASPSPIASAGLNAASRPATTSPRTAAGAEVASQTHTRVASVRRRIGPASNLSRSEPLVEAESPFDTAHGYPQRGVARPIESDGASNGDVGGRGVLGPRYALRQAGEAADLSPAQRAGSSVRIERLTTDQKVGGSNPSRRTTQRRRSSAGTPPVAQGSVRTGTVPGRRMREPSRTGSGRWLLKKSVGPGPNRR
jgi:hypothetical protein